MVSAKRALSIHEPCKSGNNKNYMLKQERHYRILERLRQTGKIVALDVSQEFGVSEDTIRRDLRELAQAGKVQRVHGGALPRSPATGVFAERVVQAAGAKAALAPIAARFVQDGQVVLLDGGTTNEQVAKHLPRTLSATIVTPSPSIALALLDYPQVEVLLLGGRVSKVAAMTISLATAEAVHAIRADICILGVCSLHPNIGISVADAEEAHLKRIMIAQSAEIVAVAIAGKLGTALPHVVGPLALLTQLITEPIVPESVLAAYRRGGLTVTQR